MLGANQAGSVWTRAWSAGVRRPLTVAACAAILLFTTLALASAPSASADSGSFTSYSSTQKIPVPPASAFAGQGGCDGWALAVGTNQVFNVFHHLSTLTVACHNQTDASACWDPRHITDGSGNEFATEGQPGLHLDAATGKLYVFAVRTSDQTGGVVCIDTTTAASNTNPFCGFTALTAVGDAPLQNGYAGIANPSLIGSHWYAFNYVGGAAPTGTQDKLLCFDVSTAGPCSGQPFSVTIGSGAVATDGYPEPAQAAIGKDVIIPINVGGADELACFDDTSQANCAGSWPATLASSNYVSQHGAPFPLMDGTGAILGVCLPNSGVSCFTLGGDSTPTPANLASTIGGGTSPWSGPAIVLGPRVYIPDGNTENVDCFDYNTGANCANFPKHLDNLDLLYTVNPDPQRPTCIWVNADNGAAQIQNFDAYTGSTCGKGDVRVLASQFVVPQAACTPNNYDALQVVSPTPDTYTSGTITFNDGDGNPIPGAADRPLDATGATSLTGLNLNTPTGLPQFVIALSGETGDPGQIEVKLDWTATYDPSCVGPGTTASPPPAPPAPPASGGSSAAAPTLSGAPSISGTPLPGSTLTCQPGSWTGSPTGFTYGWNRNGNPIAGATGATYVVQIADEAATITCTVVARNATGSSKPANSPGVVIGYPAAMGCPKPTGSLAGTTVGVFPLGGTQDGERKINNRFNRTQNGFDNFCLYAGWGIRVGYPSTHLLAKLSTAARSRYAGKAVLALTANPYYALNGVKPGTKLATVAKKLHVAKPFHVGVNFWYFLPGKNATGVLKVRGGIIQEVGLANVALTRTRAQQRTFIRSFTNS
jgi:hypothetical protein